MEQNNRPNILWLCTDQQRFDTLGCYGNPFVRTPNLDRLAQSGVRFANAYCQNPVCTPSRASFLTGRYPRTCRTRQNGQSIPEDEVLVTRLLHDAGYIGGLSGKLHISTCNYSVCKTRERRINDGYDYFAWSHGHGPAHEWPMHDYALWLQRQGVEYSHPLREDSRYVRVGMPPELHQTKWCADCAIEFMEAVKNEGRPWFFSINWFDPHHAFDPPAAYLERYLPILDQIPLPNYEEGELANKSPLQRLDHLGAYGKRGSFAYDDMTERDHRMIRAAYYAMIDFIDVQVGRLVDYLEASGQLENTVILFHSDHGESLGDHGLYLKGGYFYEGSVHVPLIMAWKDRFLSGVTADAPVELVDLAPTLLDLCGLPPCPGMQGRSLCGLLTGEAPTDVFRDNVYAEFYKTDMQGGVQAFCTMLYARRVCDTVSDGATEKELQLKTLVQALMQYGAAAQTYFGYNTDALMNDGFDAVAFDEAMLADRVEASAADANDIHWFGCSMVLDDALTYQFYFLVSEDAVAAANGELFFAYTVGTDETVRTVTLDANGYFYSAKVSGIAAKDMDLVVSGRVYYQSGDTTVEGPTVSYNALGYTHHILDYGTYGDTTEALAKAIAVYADAARRYWKA